MRFDPNVSDWHIFLETTDIMAEIPKIWMLRV